jgi:hypothetical protein
MMPLSAFIKPTIDKTGRLGRSTLAPMISPRATDRPRYDGR